MAFSVYDSISAVSISTTEISILTGTSTLTDSTDDGVFVLVVDGIAAAMAKGDEFIIKIYTKCLSGSTRRLIMTSTLSDVQSELWVSPQLLFVNDWQMTLTKVAGTDRNFDAAIYRVS